MRDIALIVIDAQEDFTRGALRNEEAIAALPKIAELVKHVQNIEGKIFYTQDIHDKDYLNTQEGRNLPVPHCIKDTEGWEICKEVRTDSMRTVLKESFGFSHWSTVFTEKPDEIWLCGFCTDICVSANFQLLKATFPETPIIVVEDCCAGVTPELHDAAIKVMKSCQAQVKTLEEIKNEI